MKNFNLEKKYNFLKNENIFNTDESEEEEFKENNYEKDNLDNYKIKKYWDE